MSGLPNVLARDSDPRTQTPVGFGDPSGSWVWFRRVFRDGSNAPDWKPNPRIVADPVPMGGVDRQNIGYDPDTLSLRVEVESSADAETLRTLVGTESTLVLPDLQYSGSGTHHQVNGTGYRYFDDVFLASADPEGSTIINVFRFVCQFERARTAPS